MPFRILYATAFVALVLNLGLLLRLSAANAVEKSVFLLAIASLFVTRKQDPVVVGLMLLQIALVFVLALLTTNQNFSWSIFLNSINQIVLVFALISSATTEKDQVFIWRLAAALPALCALLGIMYQTAGIGSMFAKEFTTGVPRFVGSLSAAAFTSALAMCGVYAAVKLMLTRNRMYMLLVLVNLAVLLAAGGRAALAVAVMICAFAVFMSRSVRLADKLMISAAGLVSGLLVLSIFWENLSTRLLESGDNGRTVMWDYLKEVIAAYPDYGIGFGHQFFTTPRYVEIQTGSPSAHNDYLRLAAELGTNGMYLFYAILTAAVVRACFRNGRRNFEGLIVYGGFLVMSNSDNAFASPFEFPLILLGLLCAHEARLRTVPRQPRVSMLRTVPGPTAR